MHQLSHYQYDRAGNKKRCKDNQLTIRISLRLYPYEDLLAPVAFYYTICLGCHARKYCKTLQDITQHEFHHCFNSNYFEWDNTWMDYSGFQAYQAAEIQPIRLNENLNLQGQPRGWISVQWSMYQLLWSVSSSNLPQQLCNTCPDIGSAVINILKVKTKFLTLKSLCALFLRRKIIRHETSSWCHFYVIWCHCIENEENK